MNKYSSYFTRNKHKAISYHLNTAKRQFSYNWSKYRAHRGSTISDKHLQSSFTIPLASNEMIAEHFRKRQKPKFIIDPKEKDKYIRMVKKLFPEKIDHTIQEADQVCNHIFNLLGSGPVDLSSKINWHCDFKSGYQWPRVYYKEICYRDYEKGCDIKVPRELSRFQHSILLGKAYWYTSDEKYAREFVAQVDDWINENPPEIGVNWQCTMDVAIRIVNWIWGFYFFKDSKSITNEFIIRFLKSCLIHGRHIRGNLEWNEKVTSNHYISDLVGLVVVGIIFPEFKQAEEWRSFATKELLAELRKQVYDDGMDYEASTAYHRLVLELYYTTALLARLNGYEWPRWAWDRIYRMFKFVQGIIKTNGKIPQIGDNDSGRLQILESQNGLSQMYLFPIASILFNDPSFKLKGIAFSEEALWFLGPNAYQVYLEMPESTTIDDLPSCHFKNGGLYVIRAKDNYCIISCGANGQNGSGGHCHNDKLSFELRMNGEDIIVDPGTYVYTSDYKARNLFRSTEYHNTIRINGLEINEYKEKQLFRMQGKGRGRIIKWESTERYDLFEGYHDGYYRLDPPVTHTRRIHFDKAGQLWIITDSVSCTEMDSTDLYKIESFFHFGESVKKIEVSRAESNLIPHFEKKKEEFRFFNKGDITKISLVTDNQECSIYVSNCIPEDVDVYEGWISKRYGHCQTAKKLKIKALKTLPHEYLFLIANVPAIGVANNL